MTPKIKASQCIVFPEVPAWGIRLIDYTTNSEMVEISYRTAIHDYIMPALMAGDSVIKDDSFNPNLGVSLFIISKEEAAKAQQ